MKPIIGIIPTYNLENKDYVRNDTSIFYNRYSKKIIENGGIPIGLLFENNRIDTETLDLCDGILIPGGEVISKIALDIVDYAFKKKIPILGICLGLQTIGEYLIANNVCKLDNNVEFHNHLSNKQITYKEAGEKKHSITINKKSILFNLFNTETIEVNSFHHDHIKEIPEPFIVSAIANDGCIEAIESTNDHFVLGVQWHPETMDNMDIIFKTFFKKSLQ